MGEGGRGVEIRKIHHDRQGWAKSKKEIDIEPPSAIQKTTIVTKLLREAGEASVVFCIRYFVWSMMLEKLKILRSQSAKLTKMSLIFLSVNSATISDAN